MELDEQDDQEFRDFMEEKHKGIPCKKFPCLDLIIDLTEAKIQREANEIRAKIIRATYDKLPIYFHVYQKDPEGRKHYDHRILIHINEIMRYLNDGIVKDRFFPEDL